jgi:RNA polymerase sigma-70 factor, ECF subfamily
MKEVSQLVEAAQAGDSEAYAALVQRFQGMAYAIASRYVGDHHLAQDLVQDAVIEAFLHLPQLKEPSAFPGWFRQIVFRQCTRLLRQATLPSSSLEAASADLIADRDTEDLVMQAEREAAVRAALASLPRHEQLVAALFYGCGYSYKEVSAFLKIPITTVKKRLHSARQKLRMPLQVTLRDEIEQANASRARKEEAAERAGRSIRTARWLKRVASTLAWEASRPSCSNVNGTHVCLPRVA